MNIQKAYDKYFKKWQWTLDNLGWNVGVEYLDNGDDMPGDGAEAYAVVQAQFAYLSAVISVNLKKSKTLSLKEVEEVVVHEICHVLLAPLEVEPGRDLEYTVTSISRIMCGITGVSKKV